jgi:hypothetical protein
MIFNSNSETVYGAFFGLQVRVSASKRGVSLVLPPRYSIVIQVR